MTRRVYSPPPPDLTEAEWRAHCDALDHYESRMGQCVIPEHAYREPTPYPREWGWDCNKETCE